MGRGRSKEMGAPVDDLTHDELLKEKSRCEDFIKNVDKVSSVKGMRKRLRKIIKRLELDGTNET